VNGAGPAPICTFAGTLAARLTTAARGDYFDDGSIQHLSHVILDMLQFFDMDNEEEPPGADGIYTERVQYMFHAPSIAAGHKDPYADGGDPALLPNENRGRHYAERTAQGIGTAGCKRRMGHLSCLQRTSRAADGTPLHIRMDGPGVYAKDVPGGGNLPKLQFTIFVPTASSSARCAPARLRSTCRRSTVSPSRTTAWSASSSPPGGRTSSPPAPAPAPSR
jgi:hypothetical protein